ncbi:MAG: hypothetical protein KKC37_03875, partial [Proteobacteria bacterium]|nr:hypothetical protein [Pseudomonadota bacterium]
VLDYCRANLPPGQVPDRVAFVDDFPTTRSGKVQKYKLSEMAKQEGAD